MEPTQNYPPTTVPLEMAPPGNLSTRALVIGILNIAFAVIFLGCTGIGLFSLLTLANQSRDIFGGNAAIYTDTLNVLTNGGAFLGLLAAGILLLSRKKAGRTITLVLAIAVPILALTLAGITVRLFSGLSAFRQSEVSQTSTIIGVFVGTILRALYPVIAGAVLLPKPEELGLSE